MSTLLYDFCFSLLSSTSSLSYNHHVPPIMLVSTKLTYKTT